MRNSPSQAPHATGTVRGKYRSNAGSLARPIDRTWDHLSLRAGALLTFRARSTVRAVLCWLTVVDLRLRRPNGRYNLPPNAPYSREAYMVPAEVVTYDPSWKPTPPPPPPAPPPRKPREPSRRKSSVQFAIPPELDQPPRPLLGNVSKDTRKSMRMTRDKLRALGQRRSFKVDGFELEKGTREHPGRRMSHGPRDGKQIRAPVLTNVPLAAAPGPSSAPSSAQDRRPSVQLTSPAEQTQPPRPLLGNVSKDTRKSMRMTRDKLRALGQRRSFKMDGFSDVVTRERPGKLSERKVGASARASSQRPVSPPRGSQTQQQPYGVDVDALPRESNDEMDDSPAGELSVLADARPKRRKRRMRRDAAAVVEV
jgi:hypothetical protein